LFIVEDNTSELAVWNWNIGELILAIQDEAESALPVILISIVDMLQS
jgi:hypothetical protein